jgi:hypothetical protein
MLEKAQRYRDQVAHMRTLADKEEHELARKALLEMAESYERLCQKWVDLPAKATKDQSWKFRWPFATIATVAP